MAGQEKGSETLFLYRPYAHRHLITLGRPHDAQVIDPVVVLDDAESNEQVERGLERVVNITPAGQRRLDQDRHKAWHRSGLL